jgi:hypothetical protein
MSARNLVFFQLFIGTVTYPIGIPKITKKDLAEYNTFRFGYTIMATLNK